MSKSKNWTAFVGDTLTSSALTLTVSGEINTGGVHQHAELTKKDPQGIVKAQLIIEAMLFILLIICSSVYCQPSFPVKFNEYRLTDSKLKIDSNPNLMRRVLNQQFINLITGQTKNSIGNFASIDPTDATISFAGNLIINSGSVLTAKAKGGVSDGLLPVFQNSKLNTNISLDIQYNLLALRKRKLLITNVDSTDQYERSIDKIEYDYNIKRLGITSYRDSFQMIDRKPKTQKVLDSLDNVLKNEKEPTKLSILTYERGKVKFFFDSLENAINRYDTLEELQILHNKVVPQLDKLSLQSSVEGFSFGWFSFAYKVSNNSFRFFSPTLLFANQLADTSFVSHEARVQYSYYNWVPQKFRTFFFDVGLAFSYSDNFNSLILL